MRMWSRFEPLVIIFNVSGCSPTKSMEDNPPRVEGSWQFFNYLRKNGDWVCLSICFCTSLSLFWRLPLVISVVKSNNTFHSFGFNLKSARSLFSCEKKLKCDGCATRCDVSLLKFTAKKSFSNVLRCRRNVAFANYE